MKYDVVSTDKLSDLVGQVNYLLNTGYRVSGDIVVTSHKEASNERAKVIYTQVMVLEGE